MGHNSKNIRAVVKSSSCGSRPNFSESTCQISCESYGHKDIRQERPSQGPSWKLNKRLK